MQNCKEKNSSGLFEWIYKVLCRERNVKPLPLIQMCLQKNCLRLCADHVSLKDWSPLLNGIMQDRSLSKICVYCRYRHKKIREKINAEGNVTNLRKFLRANRRRPVLYANSLLRCFVHSVAVCLRNSLMITSLVLDGIPLTPKYLRILSDGLANNRNLRSLSLARCRIGDEGCDILFESLQCNPSLRILNLTSCCLTNRSATYLSLFFKNRRADLLQNAWEELTRFQDDRSIVEEGLRILILDRNKKFSNIGLQHLTRVLRNDFWLKTLSLRYCGITQRGGETVLDLLHTNNILTQIDLRDNEVSSVILQTIRKILNRRRSNEGKRIPMKKRLLSYKHGFMQNTISEITLRRNKFFNNQDLWHEQKRRRINRKYKSLDIVKRSHIDANKLKKSLSFMIKRNQNLMSILKDSTDFLINEKDRRLKAEEAYYKIQPQLKDLKNKIAMQNSIRSNMHYESQVYTDLQSMFNELKISTRGKVLHINDIDMNFGKDITKIKSVVYFPFEHPLKNEIGCLSPNYSK